MNLQEYLSHLTACLASNPPDLGDEDSILGILYEALSESNAMYDDEIKAGFHTLYEAMNGLSLSEIDQISYPVCTLCRSHQKSGFIEGIRIGILLCAELITDNRTLIRPLESII